MHSVYEEGPFKSCTVCGETLSDGRLYEIQKVYRGKEVIFEMAVCHSCGENVSREFSEESFESVKQFLSDNFRPSGSTVDSEDKDLYIPQHCQFCGFPRTLVENYTIVGACLEHSLIWPSIMMCENCSEQLQTKLSVKTRDAQGDFIRDHFPGIPSDLDLSPSFSGIFG